MRFRTVVIAAVVLVLASVAGFAAFQLAEQARGEAAQQTIERTDSLAVEPNITQTLVADADHEPTRYGDAGTETVVYNGTTWEPDGNYTYDASAGTIEFLRNETGEANITYQYLIPANQAADDQLRTLTEGYGLVVRVGIGLAFVVLLLFVGGFFARRLGAFDNSTTRGR